ncbi:DsbA family protein [Limnochorda pilosa]|uniref:DsbA family protein n=1 Tax=Limnochorda pilosa TaxID=1555112 RepID=UPI00130E1119|nr:DsbA family protein [Limnochorda pilosa]
MSQVSRRKNRRGGGPASRRFWWAAAIVLVAAAAGLLFSVSRPGQAAGWEAVEEVLGSPDAPLTVVTYVDFSCPHCGTFALEVEPELVERYVKTGKVRLVYRPMAFLGPGSILAAQAGACVGDQDPALFWPFQRRVFEELHTSGSQYTRENLATMAREIGANAEAVDACLAAGRYRDTLGRVRRLAIEEDGVRVTPTVLVGDQKLEGVPEAADFFALIDRKLAQTGS